jgi:hypothetical protein
MSAQLFTRAWPVTDVHEAFDRWQLEKHLPDLVQGPGILRAAYYRTVLEGLPEAYHGSGSCMARYTASTLDDLLTWLGSPVVPAAIQDGSRWFGSFNELDGSTYTGNVYREVAALGPDDPADGEPDLVFVERFEVAPGDAEAFDRWLLDRHAPRTAEQPGVARARVFHAERENIPIDYYLSPGNRMLEVDHAPTTGSEALLANGFRELLNDSLAWDLRLPYVKRDVYRFLGRADAERSSPA